MKSAWEGAPQLKSPCLVYELCSKVLVVIFTFLTFRPKISQGLRMLSRSLIYCLSLTLNVLIQVSQLVRNNQLCQSVTKSLCLTDGGQPLYMMVGGPKTIEKTGFFYKYDFNGAIFISKGEKGVCFVIL